MLPSFAYKLAKDSFQGTVTDHVKYLANERAMDMVLGKTMALEEAMIKQMTKEDDNSFLEKLDPTGLAKLIDVQGDSSSSTADLASAWLGVFSTFDPTGWISVAANFAKPICKDAINKVENQAKSGQKPGAGTPGGSTGTSKNGKR